LQKSGKAEEMGEIKLANARIETTAAARFLYMVVLYMAPEEELLQRAGAAGSKARFYRLGSIGCFLRTG
jgi:hypothetical protein